MSTLRQLLSWGSETLEKAEVPDSGQDAWMLMEEVFGIEKSYYFLHGTDKIDPDVQKRYEEMIRDRAKRIPVQYLTGKAWFMGYEFLVNSSVLIPRFDTEVLVEETIKHIMPGCRLLDVCTGSGCILLSLLEECKGRISAATGVDISKDALQVAIANRNRMGLTADFRESDLFSDVEGVYDVIVSNPPYIATKELEGLMPEVREHEPILALDGMEDGLYFYRKIVAQAGEYLEQGGWLCFEIGYDQGEALKEMMTEAGYGQVKIIKDLAEKESCVIVGRCADAILKDDPDCIGIFLSAPLKTRIQTVMKRDGLDEKAAKRRIEQTDRRRADNYRYYTRRIWGMSGNYQMCIDTSLGEDYVINTVLDLVKNVNRHVSESRAE